MRLNKILFVLLLMLNFSAFAQQFGFEWIKPYQPYFKIKIVNDGVYAIDPALFTQNGINLSNINPKRFQIFRNGLEIPLYIHGQSDTLFNSNDFLEFYAEHNDGSLDSGLYKQASFQPHTYKSMFTDTAVYFLTILPDTTSIIAKRLDWVNNTNFGAYTAEPYFMHEVKISPTDFSSRNNYFTGPDLYQTTHKYTSAEYLEGEGWADAPVSMGASASYVLNTPFKNISGILPDIDFKILPSNNAAPNANGKNHHFIVSIGPDNTSFTPLTNTLCSGYGVQNFTVNNLSYNLIGNTNSVIKLEVINDLGVAADIDALSYVKLRYAHQYNLGNQTNLIFNLNPVQGGLWSNLTFQNYGNGTFSTPILYDLSLNKRIKGVYNAGSISMLDSNDGQPHKVFLTDSIQIVKITNLIPVNFQTIASKIDVNAGYNFLMITHPTLENVASQYRDYRNLKYKTLMVYSQELYDYYTFGNMHPLAIRKFATHFLKRNNVKPQFLLLAGRGYQTDLIRVDKQYYDNNLVPSVGVPSSDIMLTSGIVGTGFEADIPTGRIPAQNAVDLNNYLQKLKYYETNFDSIKEWRKNILHISGGDDLGSQNTLQGYLNADGQIIKGKSFGANVYAYNKTSNLPVDRDLRNSLLSKQDSGVSMVTFFGHGSATFIDVDFGSVAEMNNKNKYPFYYMNGCDIGNANDVDPSTAGLIYGKDYICTPDKGAIGWLASSNLSFDGNLGSQMDAFYRHFTLPQYEYGKPITYVIQQASKSMYSANDEVSKVHNLQWIYQGDPAVIIYSPSLADYTVNSSDIFITPTNTTALSDSFAVGVIITNLGRSTDDSVEITLDRRILSTNKFTTYPSINHKSIYYKDTVYFWIKSKDAATFGNSIFCVTIDKSKKLNEISTANNYNCATTFIPGTGLQNIYPMNFSIVNGDSVTLFAQNNDLFASNTQYIFEIDTIPLNAPSHSAAFKSSGVITSSSIASWKLSLPVTSDTVVYFWHSKLYGVPADKGGLWNESSFTRIRQGESGWAQSKMAQYKNVSSYNLLMFDSASNQIQFVDNFQTVTVKNSRWTHANMGTLYPDTKDPSTGTCVTNGVVVDIFNGKTLQQFENPRFPFNCSWVTNWNASNSLKYYYYTFNTTIPSGRDELRRFIDSLDDGTYIAMWSRYDAAVPSWDTITKQYLSKIGSNKVGYMNAPYGTFAMIGRKGWTPGMAQEDTLYNSKYIGQPVPNKNDHDSVKVTLMMQGKWFTGNMQSDKIGPTAKWGKVYYSFKSIENSYSDHAIVELVGVKNDGTDSVIYQDISNGTDISGIQTSKFPYLKLNVTFTDSNYHSPNQFGNWMVTYQRVAEGTINPLVSYEFYNDKIARGDSIKFKIGFQNITDAVFDSLPISIVITDANRNIRYTKTFTNAPLSANASSVISQKISTLALSGDNILQLSVNSSMRTPEITLSNNVWTKNFNVQVDKTNPIMDVTFDGYRIMNGDYVSPTPTIRVSSKDDNQYLIQNDTSTFAVSLKRPNNNNFERVSLNTNNVRFLPGTAQNNKATLEYAPDKLADGIYTLQVMAKDATGNLSGNNQYVIDFTVVNESKISNFFPYPNPCTTNMKFVFTLTGSKAPDDLLIRIMTITGKVVREVTKNEFGNIHIGNNISEWSWDGTDMFGDRLANGVYLYQVLTRMDGNSITKLETKADHSGHNYLIQNTGKIYLMH